MGGQLVDDDEAVRAVSGPVGTGVSKEAPPIAAVTSAAGSAPAGRPAVDTSSTSGRSSSPPLRSARRG